MLVTNKGLLRAKDKTKGFIRKSGDNRPYVDLAETVQENEAVYMQ
jgi:hypothetical protein